ncbi:MAG: ABC transporter substrate-binding protein [Bacteroidota bacterium]
MKVFHRKRTACLLAVAALALAGLAGCADKSVPPGDTASSRSNSPILIGLAGPMTGDGAEYGKAFEDGVKLAVDQFNARGGYQGRKVEVVLGDDKNEPGEAAKVATKFASDSDIVAVIGHWSSTATLAGVPIYERGQVPMITPTASHPDITKPDTKWIFRSSTTQDLEGKNLAELAVKKLGKKRIAVVYINTDWGKANSSFFKQYAEESGARVVAYEAYPPDQGVDFTAMLTKIKGLQPDLVYLGSLYAEGVRIIKQAKELGITADFLGSATFYAQNLLDTGGKDVEGVYLDALFIPSKKDERVQKFVKDFQARYGKTPGYFDALAYDAATIVLRALELGGPTRQGIRDAMEEEVNGLPLVTGVVQFDANRSDMNKPYVNLVIRNGQFEVLE